MSRFVKEDTLGQRIKAQRIRMGMTQEELADTMCIPKSSISAYENDKVDIKSSVIVELSEVLETTPNYLLGFKDNAGDEYADKIVALLAGIKDEKVKRMLVKQIEVVGEMNCLS